MRLRRFSDTLKVLNILAVGVFLVLLSQYAQAFNDNTNTNICKPVIQVSNCKKNCDVACDKSPKIVYKTRLKKIEKIVERRVNVSVVKTKHFKNHASLLVGYGALGNIQESNNGLSSTYRTEQGLVVGLQYLRNVRNRDNYSVHLGIQGQTNKTLSIMSGVGF